MAEKFNLLSMSGKGKGWKIFRSDAYKDHQKTPMARLFWSIRWAFGIWLACLAAFGLSFAIEHLWRYGWSPATAKWITIYFQNMLYSGGLSVFAEVPAWLGRVLLRTDLACIVPLMPLTAYYFLANDTLVSEFNPHAKDVFDEASSKKATADDIKKMAADFKNKSGLFGGFCQVLGYFKFNGKMKPLMMDETLSTLCVAPPGTGKTAGVVLPTILDCDGISMIINDPKPELKQKSSAYRATIGPVFIMNWAGQDDPARGIYYPSWNPLSPSHVPFAAEERDMYIDSICSVLIAEKAASSADPHWTISGRAALSGLIQFIVSKIERAKANDYFKARLDSGAFDADDAAVLADYYTMMSDPNAYAARQMLATGSLNSMNYIHIGTWSSIPPNWIGKEASLSMLLDWLNASQVSISEDLENRRKSGDQMVMMVDAMKELYQNAVNESIQYGYAHRAILELTQIANTPDKERGSILSTVMAGLGIFRNAAVRNRTSHSDFHFSDLRGMKDPADGKWKPVTVYLSINQVDADALNPITGIFIELMSRFLLANLPGETHAGEKLGPFPALFVLDEMPKMMKLQAVIQGPDLGRGCKVSYQIIGQDIHQIQEKYGADAAATIISTTAAKIVLRQNDLDSATKFSDMIGDKITKNVKKGADGKETTETKTKRLYSPMDIMKLPEGKQLIIYQGHYHRPIESDQERYFLGKNDIQKKLAEKVAMGESSPLPEFLIPSHHAAMGYGGTPRIYDPKKNVVRELVKVGQ